MQQFYKNCLINNKDRLISFISYTYQKIDDWTGDIKILNY